MCSHAEKLSGQASAGAPNRTTLAQKWNRPEPEPVFTFYLYYWPVGTMAGELKDSDKQFIRAVSSSVMQRMVEATFDYSHHKMAI